MKKFFSYLNSRSAYARNNIIIGAALLCTILIAGLWIVSLRVLPYNRSWNASDADTVSSPGMWATFTGAVTHIMTNSGLWEGKQDLKQTTTDINTNMRTGDELENLEQSIPEIPSTADEMLIDPTVTSMTQTSSDTSSQSDVLLKTNTKNLKP